MDSKTILVPLDGSAESEAALPYAYAIARAKGAGIRLLTVVDQPLDKRLASAGSSAAVAGDSQARRAQQYLESKAVGIRAKGIDASPVTSAGDPAEAILGAEAAEDVQIVVMATHGRGGLQRWALGSVADKVLRMGSRPALLVRPTDPPQPAREIALRRLLLPLDGSPLAEKAIEPASKIAEATGAELELVRVEPWAVQSISRWGGEAVYVPNLDELEDEVASAATAYLEGIRATLPATVRSQAIVLRGLPTPELETFLGQREIDLTVMSTHARSGLPRFILGSTADRLVRGGYPTLLVHPVSDHHTS